MTAHAYSGTRWDKAKAIESLEFLKSQQGIVIEYFTELLNSYNGLNKSAAYYDLIGGEWLLHFTHMVYAAYVDVAHGISIPQSQHPIYVFTDFGHFLQTAVNDPLFSIQLRQQIAHLINGTQEKDLKFAHRVCKLANGLPLGIWKKSKLKLKSAFLLSIGVKDAPFIICHPSLRCSKREWVFTQWKWRNWARLDDFAYPIELTCEVDSGWRRKHPVDVSVSSFADILHNLLPLYIPVIYLEGLVSYRQKAHEYNLHRPRAVYTANALHGHTLFKILVADWRDEGTKLLNHQHGGGYGIDRVHPLEDYETRVADRFYTLGWRSSNPKQVTLAGAFSTPKVKPFLQSKRVMLMCVCYPKQVHRIHLQPMPGTIETMIAETANFVRELKGRQELLVRPYFDDYGWGMVKTLKQADAELKLDDLRKSGIQSYARSSLVVHNYLGTSWLETLAMNIPTVCFYDADTYAFREDAQPYLDALSAVGVLHKNGASAAAFVLGLKNDPFKWWKTAEVQDARLAFVRNYANYSLNWAKDWEAEFKQWIE